MNILLVNPPNSGRSIPEEEYGLTSIKRIFRGEPLGLETLAGNLPEHRVEILDLKVEPLAALVPCLLALTPDIVGITAMTCEASSALAIAATVKSTLPSAITVVGGAHASNAPEYFNREPVDFICVGLGKLAFRELVDALEQGREEPGIPGIAQVVPGRALRFQPRIPTRRDLVDECPPRYDLVAKYRPEYVLSAGGGGFRVGAVVSAHGCPYQCTFCSIENMTHGQYLLHDPETVARDLRLLGGDIPVVRLVDANSFAGSRESRALGRHIAEQGLQRRFIADVRADTVVRDPALLAQWAEIGLGFVVIGFESVDDRELQAVNKQTSVDTYREAIRILHDLRIKIIGDFIISPRYTDADFDRLERFIDQQAIDLPIVAVMTPLPGTILHRQMRDEIVVHDLDYYTLTNAVTPLRLPAKTFYTRYARLMTASHAQAKL
jgi:radical SAM superfamily enzyme YgiQ (UPF0313 family)